MSETLLKIKISLPSILSWRQGNLPDGKTSQLCSLMTVISTFVSSLSPSRNSGCSSSSFVNRYWMFSSGRLRRRLPRSFREHRLSTGCIQPRQAQGWIGLPGAKAITVASNSTCYIMYVPSRLFYDSFWSPVSTVAYHDVRCWWGIDRKFSNILLEQVRILIPSFAFRFASKIHR